MRLSRDCDCELDFEAILACEAECRLMLCIDGEDLVKTGLDCSESLGRYHNGVDHGNSSSPRRKEAGE